MSMFIEVRESAARLGRGKNMREVTCSKAINEAIREETRRDRDIVEVCETTKQADEATEEAADFAIQSPFAGTAQLEQDIFA